MLYGRKCRAPICWDQVGERILEGPEMIEVTNEKVAVAREKLKEAQTRQKSYADRHRRALEFQPGEHVFLKVSPTRGVRRFGIKGKLSPRFIGPFEILDRVGEVSYRLALPPQLSHVHNVFHVSLLRGQSHEEQDDSFCQNSLEESSRAGSHLGDRGVYTDFLSSFPSMIWINLLLTLEEEEEHPALADSILPPVHRVTARMSIRDEPSTPFWSEAEIARLLDIPSPPLSPLSPWSSPLPQIPSPPLPVSSLVPVSPPPLPASPTYPLGYRAAMIWQRSGSPSTSHSLPLPPPIILSHTRASVAIMRPTAPSTYILASRSETPPLLPIPLPIPSPPLILPSTICFRADYGFIATLDDEIRRNPKRDVGYRITDTWDEMLVGMPGA
ncbi:hypothetical protein Tco_1167577, partial [Tanacetum coccineum]